MWSAKDSWHRLLRRFSFEISAEHSTSGRPPCSFFEDSRFRPAADVAARTIGEVVFLISLNQGSVYRLNPTGVMIWECIRESQSYFGMLKSIREVYSEPETRLRSDLERLLRELLMHRLIESCPAE